VLCGIPIYEYDHMPGYANVKRHHPDELTLLCPNHHAAKTKGLLADEQVMQADRNPFNRRNSATSPFALRFVGDSPEIRIAQQTFTCSDRRRPTWMIPVMIRRHAPVGFTIDTSGLMLNLEAYNTRGRPIMRIRNSELELSTSVFDVTLVGQRLTIHDQEELVALSLLFEPPNRISIERCCITTNDVTVDIDDQNILFRGERVPRLTLTGNGFIDANIGILIGEAPRGLGVGIKVDENVRFATV
jgi:hypothetical protein